MIYFKVFKVEYGDLFSAFEIGVKMHSYTVGETTKDNKKGGYCPGLGILSVKKGARQFLECSGSPDKPEKFALYQVKPTSKVRYHMPPVKKLKWGSHFVDSLIPIKLIAEKG